MLDDYEMPGEGELLADKYRILSGWWVAAGWAPYVFKAHHGAARPHGGHQAPAPGQSPRPGGVTPSWTRPGRGAG
jgi:hypothetical protein